MTKRLSTQKMNARFAIFSVFSIMMFLAAQPARAIENDVFIQQVTHPNTATAFQVGSHDEINIYQQGGVHNIVNAQQQGDNNEAQIEQTSGESTINSNQIGARNAAYLVQVGSNLAISNLEQGNDNHATLKQQGDTHQILVAQNGIAVLSQFFKSL